MIHLLLALVLGHPNLVKPGTWAQGWEMHLTLGGKTGENVVPVTLWIQVFANGHVGVWEI